MTAPTRLKAYVALAAAIALTLSAPLRLSAQSDMKGKSRDVILVPNRTVDAGEVKFKPDTDHDGMSDADEAQNGTDPNDPSDADEDRDSDGMSNGDEVVAGSNPNNADSDGDGFSDGEEVALGYNPIDSTSHPTPDAALASLQVSPTQVSLSVNTLLGQKPVSLRVTGVRTDGTTFDLTGSDTLNYLSFDEAVAIVDGAGTVAGTGAGATTVRVSSGSVSADVPVVVTTVTPAALSGLFIPGYANNVDVAGDYAYVAAGSAGLVVIDMHDRRGPFITATLGTPGNANDVRVVGARAYVADGSSGLRIIDISTPESPVELGSFDTSGEAYDVVVYGPRAYVADGPGGVHIIDVSDPSAPSLVGSVDTQGTAKGLDVSGEFIAVANDFGGVVIVDASVPASPSIAGRTSLPFGYVALDLEVRDRFAYVAAFTGGMQVVDFSVPSSPRVIAGISNIFYPRDIALGRRYAAAADVRFRTAVPIVDLGDPSDPVYRGVIDFSALGDYQGTGVAVDDRYIYMTGAQDPFRTDNGVSGFTQFFIGEYSEAESPVSDTGGVAPTVSVESPQTGQTVTEGARLPVSIKAADDVKVALVQLIVNGVVVVKDVAAPYDITYTVPLGVTTLNVEARAFDAAGNSATSAPVQINVLPDPPPTVSIVSPAEGQPLYEGQVIPLTAEANDNDTVTEVLFTVDGQSYFNGSFFFVPLGVTSLTFEVTATDNLGHTATATRVVEVLPDTPPTISIVSPAEGAQLTEGQRIVFSVDAQDNVSVSYVDFTVNGEYFTSDFDAPYQQTYTVPVGIDSLMLEVVVHDNLDNQATAARTFSVVPDAGTTVSGRVLDTSDQPVPDATVTVFGAYTAQTGADGSFSIPGVSTVRGEVVARATATIGGKSTDNASLPADPVLAGVTDVGVIKLSTAPTAPVVLGVADYTGDFRADLFIGYPDRQSLIYEFNVGGQEFAGGDQFAPSANTELPFGAITSGSAYSPGFSSTSELYTQITGLAGRVRATSFANGLMQPPLDVTTGLDRESEETAFGLDTQNFPNRKVLAFMARDDSGGTLLTVRLGNTAGGGGGGPVDIRASNDAPKRGATAAVNSAAESGDFGPPVSIPVAPNVKLRSLRLVDVTGDRLVDLVAIRQVSGSDGRLVVFPRMPDNSFGAPVESPVVIRSGAETRGMVDISVGASSIPGETYIYVLADDRVGVYEGDAAGAFTLDDEIALPSGQVPTGIIDGNINNDFETDVIITTADTSSPESKYMLIALGVGEPPASLKSAPGGSLKSRRTAAQFGAGFQTPVARPYSAPVSAGDTRIAIGNWAGRSNSVDVVVIDGETIRLFVDVGPIFSGS